MAFATSARTSGARQAGILLAALGLCPLAAVLIGDDPAGAVGRARWLMAAERTLGVDVEQPVHAWALAHRWILDTAGALYIVAHIAVPGWALVWTWFVRRDRFALVRDAFLGTQAVLVAVYVMVPTAPPRLVPRAGFTDTLSGLWGRQAADSVHLLQSPYAAVPSGHVAFALLAGITFTRLGDMAWLRVFGWLYPPLMVAVTVLTANHLLADAFAAVLVVSVTLPVARRRNGTTRASTRGLAPTSPGVDRIGTSGRIASPLPVVSAGRPTTGYEPLLPGSDDASG